jgi:predicted methyltransferase
MKINLNQLEQQKFEHLLDTKEINISLADMYLDYLENNPYSIDDNAIKSMHATSNDYAFFLCLMNVLEIDLSDKENMNIATNNILPGIKELDAKKYENNEYYKEIKVNDEKYKDLELKTLSYEPFEGFSSSDLTINQDNYYKETTNIGFFNQKFDYLAILQNNEIWMSITPNEIETMKDPIAKANGNIVTFGLGLGYFAYMTSLKNDVKSITIIDNNQNLIDLFKTKILPQFKYQEKIKIINADAINFLTSSNMSKFDYAFIDLWHNPNDGIDLYLNFKSKEKNYTHTTFTYWLETGILALLRRCLISLIDEEIQGSTDSDYEKSEIETDTIINKLHFYLSDYKINSYEDIKKLLTDESLKSIANNLYN